MSERYYTIKELADIAGTSKVTMFRFIKKNSFHETKHRGNANLYSETDKNSILEGFNHKNGSKINETKRNETSNELIEELKKQIAMKDSQISELHEIINKDQKLLDQQQQLNLSSQKLLESKNDIMQSRKNDSKDDKNNPDTNINEQNKKPSSETQKSFWKRFFR
ncbi:helix-turn-helix domain-containing protein [Lentilactobacillus hilgardii]|uniref:helix-turn-helix domain-containing protein n=1 Tax=Lentilactobacillus hilgardii TaxID=1588 RepID=UPI0021A2AB20|nr:helix-turn-helix domain-containing protein [Lentilactobacillus hilgardii]MCT3395833.1 replication protein B [Lentilactobacillus hilgardii]